MKIMIVAEQAKMQKMLAALDTDRHEISCIVVQDVACGANYQINYSGMKIHGCSYEFLQEKIAEVSYDYVLIAGNEDIIASQLLEFGVDAHRIVNMRAIVTDMIQLYANAVRAGDIVADVAGLLTLGSSHASYDILASCLNGGAIHLAGFGQSFQYSHMVAKKVLNNTKGKIKYAIIGLVPYSFHVDWTDKIFNWGQFMYYPQFKDDNNVCVNQLVKSLFKDDYWDMVLAESVPQETFVADNPYNFKGLDYSEKNLSAKDRIKAKNHISDLEKHLNNNNLEKNISALIELLRFLKSNSISPILVGLPLSPTMNKFYPKERLEEFYKVLDDARAIEPFYFVDAFAETEVENDEFYDLERLNLQGAKRFSSKIDTFIKNVSKFHIGIKKHKIRVAFLMQCTTCWNHIQPVYEQLLENDKFEIYGIVVPGYEGQDLYAGKPFGEYGVEKEYFHGLYKDNLIDAVDEYGNIIDIKPYQFDYVFYQRPYEPLLPPTLRCVYVKNFAKTCYIPYAVIGAMKYEQFALAQVPFFKSLYKHFPETKHMENVFLKAYGITENENKDKFKSFGNPGLDSALKKRKKNFGCMELGRYNLLWTPRWCGEDTGESSFLAYKDLFIDLKKEYPEIGMTLRPHPLTFSELLFKGIFTQEQVDEYKSKLKKNGVALDDNTLVNETFEKNNILITDYSSIVILYFITGNPIIYCPSDDVVFNETYAEIADGLYMARSWEEIRYYLQQIVRGNDFLKEKRESIIKRLTHEHDGASKRIIAYLESDYNKE